MQKIEYKYGFKVVNNYPDYTSEQQKKVNEKILQKLYEILFSDEKNNL